MPITTGSLTQRLGQFLADVTTLFTAVTDIRLLLQQLTAPTATAGRLTLFNLQSQIDLIRGTGQGTRANLYQVYTIISDELIRLNASIGIEPTEPTVRANLRYLTQSGDGTPLQRNLQSVVDEIFLLGGALPNHSTLFDLRQALVSPTGPRLQEIVEKLDILLDEKLGTPPNSLTGLELLQLVADCVCELNEKFPPIEPPPSEPMIPAAHLCAPNAPILFTITPVDWYEWSPGLWAACPSSLNAGMEQWVIVERELVFGSGGTYPVLRLIDGERANALTFCNVTGASTGEIAVLEPQHGRDFLQAGVTVVDFSSGADVAGVTDGPNGCKTIALLNSELPDVYWRLNADLGGADGSDRPNETYYFYEVVPN